MAATHPDFEIIQRRLRRMNPAWYAEPAKFDTEYGPSMARGIDAALDMLEIAHGLAPFEMPPAARPAAVVAPASVSSALPAKFQFLLREPIAPLMVRVASDMLGLVETPGSRSNAKIVGWADEVANAMPSTYNRWAADWYNDDSVPWCGLFMAAVAVRAAQGRVDRMPPDKYLSALAWAKWCLPVPKDQAAVGDVMVLTRSGGGHVTLCVGIEQGGRRFFGLGGNQGDAVTIAPFDLARVSAVRRPPYRELPPGARRVIVGPGGPSSSNEA